MDEKPDWMQPKGEPWGRGEPRLVYDNPWLSLIEQPATAPTGAPALYGMVHFKNAAVGVVPLHADGTITLVGQHRFPRADYSWELPEGGAPLDEEPLAGAQRELREEAGLVAADWREILRFQLSNSVTNEVGYGYLALGLSEVETAPDETEVLKIVRVPFREALSAGLAGHIHDMITLALLLRVHHMAVEGQLPDSLTRAVLG